MHRIVEYHNCEAELMNRRGDWIQIFSILLFFLILLFTITLLFIEKANFNPFSQSLVDDVRQQKGHTTLISLLRQPIQFDISGDGVPDSATVTDAIIHKEEAVIEQAFGNLYGAYRYTITYPNGTKLEGKADHELVGLTEFGSIVEIFLPGTGGNIQLHFEYIDEDIPRSELRRKTAHLVPQVMVAG